MEVKYHIILTMILRETLILFFYELAFLQEVNAFAPYAPDSRCTVQLVVQTICMYVPVESRQMETRLRFR